MKPREQQELQVVTDMTFDNKCRMWIIGAAFVALLIIVQLSGG